jgi:hypothetical protein
MGYIRHLVTSPLQPEPPRVASRDGPAKAVAEIGTYSPLDAVNSGINLASAAMQSSDALPVSLPPCPAFVMFWVPMLLDFMR